MNLQVCRLLDDEHRTSLALLARWEAALARGASPGTDLAAALVHQIEDEVPRHFGFEEERLFPLLDEAGEGDLARLLAEEHETLYRVAAELLPLARALRDGTPGDAAPARLVPLAREWIERLGAHIEKETMALLPALDGVLDDDTDRTLAFTHATQEAPS